MNLFLASLLSLLSLATIVANAQYVTTILDSPDINFTDDLIFDDEGNLYCSDYAGIYVYKRTPSGEITIFTGPFDSPNGLAFDSNGNLFVCDNTGDLIVKFDSEGNFLDSYIVDNPSGLIKKLDSDTLIFTQYSPNSTLMKLAPDGTMIEMFSGSPLDGPVGLDYDETGQLYVANYGNREIYKVMDDELIYLATVPGPSNGVLGFISYGGDKLWATSWNDYEIYAVGLDEIDDVTSYAGSTYGDVDGPISEAKFTSPNGILSTPSGDSLFISEYATGNLRLISPDNTTNTFKILDEEIGHLKVFPNPSSGSVNLEFTHPEVAEVLVFDALGRQVYRSTSIQTNMRFILETSGVYSISVLYKNGKLERGQVVIN